MSQSGATKIPLLNTVTTVRNPRFLASQDSRAPLALANSLLDIPNTRRGGRCLSWSQHHPRQFVARVIVRQLRAAQARLVHRAVGVSGIIDLRPAGRPCQRAPERIARASGWSCASLAGARCSSSPIVPFVDQDGEGGQNVPSPQTLTHCACSERHARATTLGWPAGKRWPPVLWEGGSVRGEGNWSQLVASDKGSCRPNHVVLLMYSTRASRTSGFWSSGMKGIITLAIEPFG
jgi:hypothetical protein